MASRAGQAYQTGSTHRRRTLVVAHPAKPAGQAKKRRGGRHEREAAKGSAVQESRDTVTTIEGGERDAPLPKVGGVALLASDIGRLIESARRQVAQAANAALTALYWQIGTRIRQDVLKERRAEYGAEIVSALGKQLEARYGRSRARRLSRHCCDNWGGRRNRSPIGRQSVSSPAVLGASIFPVTSSPRGRDDSGRYRWGGVAFRRRAAGCAVHSRVGGFK